MRRTIAYVEDDAVIRENYSDMLTDEGFDIVAYSSKEEAITAFRSRELPDLALLDLSLDGERDAGYDVCAELRRMSKEVPIIFLTSHDSEMDKISGLRLGADDYITKDASINYIVIRIEALFRRLDALRSIEKGKDQEQTVGSKESDPVFDDTFSTVEWRGEKVNLPLTQFWILRDICSHPGKIRNHRDLMKAASIVVEPNTITAHVKSLRDAFRRVSPDFDSIKTERGKGYRWVPE